MTTKQKLTYALTDLEAFKAKHYHSLNFEHKRIIDKLIKELNFSIKGLK